MIALDVVIGLARRVPWPVWLAAGVLVFYEGVPVIRHIPFIERVPVAGYLLEGRVNRSYRAGFAEAERIALERARARQAEWDEQTERARQAQERLAVDFLMADHLTTTFEQQLFGDVNDADYLCAGPVFSDGLSERLDRIGRD